jgi:RNA polymerase II subunit A small phosphatase-like protein
MDYFSRRNLYNNNKSPPIILNGGSFNQKFPKNNISRVTPSYSGNPHLIRNYKTNIYSSNNYFSTSKSQQMNNGEIINSRLKNNSNYNSNLNNNNSKNIVNYAQYSRYLKPTKSFTGYNNNNFLSPNRIKNENFNYNHNIQPPNLRSKILNLSNNYKKKSISKNFSMQYLPIKNKFNFLSPKKKLILDLDETLVHSGFNPFTRQSDISLQINIDGKIHTINILKRPYVDEFLKEISNYYEIYVFTASMEEYASPVIDLIDKNNIIKGKFFRQDCIYNNDLYIKDLFKVTNDLKDVIIIDNNPSSYATNEDNGIPIKTWYDDLNDNELIKLIPVLKYLSNVNDVRSIISQIVDKRNNEVDFNIVNRIINGNENDIGNNIINNKKYENNFYYEINESKIKNNNENDNYYSRYDRYKEYNNINSFSNMSYNEIQNEADHANSNNYIFNFKRFNNSNNKEEEIKYNQGNLNENENIYKHNYSNSFYIGNNNLMKNLYLEQEKKENIPQYNPYKNNINQNQVNQNTNNENISNLIYNDKIKKIRPFTPNINRRKMNSFINIDNNNYGKKFITGYENNNNIDNQNDERDSEIKSYYEGRRFNQDNNMYKNLYKNNDLKLSTQNILNRSSSDIYLNIKRNGDNLRRYNYLLNMNNINNNDNNNEQRRETEANERKNDYYVQSYKSHLSRINYKPKDYSSNLNNNNIIKPTNIELRVNNSTNFTNITQSKNYLDYFNSKYNSNINNNDNNNMNNNMNEEKNERYNYINSYNNENMNNKRDYLDNMNEFKRQINSRFNNFRDYIRDKRKEFLQEENKSRNFEEPEIFRKEIENYGKKNYLGKNNIRNFNYSNNINYFERTNLQNLIDAYRNKYNAFENSFYKIKNKLNKSFSMDKKFLN